MQSLAVSQAVFYGRFSYNILNLKAGIGPKQAPILTSQFSKDVHDRKQMNYEDVRRNAMQAYISHKAYYDKYSISSKLKEANYVYILKPKQIIKGMKHVLRNFSGFNLTFLKRCHRKTIILYTKVSPTRRKCFIACEWVNSDTQQRLLDIRITPRLWKPNPEVSLIHDEFYARAWVCEYEKPFFDTKNDNATPPNSTETALQSYLTTEETWNTPGTAREGSREIFCDATDTYLYMEPNAETKSEHPTSSPINPRSSK